MDDDKGLELSLGLACGGSSSTSKDRSSNSADAKTDPDERTNKILNDFKNFLSAVPQSLPKNDAVKPQENFFNNLQQNGNGENVSGDEPGVGNKRKSTFEEMNDPKKQETDSRNSVIQDKDKMSHISITTDEGSTADNEDVAESEAEGSTSKLASHHEDGSRTPGGSGSSSQAPKELCGKPNSSAPFTVQMNNLNVPYSITIKEPPSASAPSTPSYSLPGMMQGITSANGERPRLHATALGSLPMSFGYSPVQLPVLDNKDSPWRMATQPQSIPATYAGISISTSVPMQAINSSSESARLDVHPSEQPKGQPLLVAEEGSSSQVEGDAKGRGSSFPSEYPAIRPGIASEMNFGGSGSFPNLPWVSTTSPGPNGKTISGVTYKYNATQIKIVCACHGVHMSPEEFVRHATEEEQTPVTTPNLTSLRSTNPTTSAKS
ncbi:ninja-family protein mc410-like isoform X2 [Chenopodium quinoa]|nr:ninja-family protein mc410-like isoform X2 [Chenopodium quinoa]